MIDSREFWTTLWRFASAPDDEIRDAPAAALAVLDELTSPRFALLMSAVNLFAAEHGLRVFTNWSKIWEYPWLWFNGLSSRLTPGARLIDIGSEISPLPWLFALVGVRVTLIERDAQWVPTWERLNRQLGVDVDWCVVSDERLPILDATADIVTSFSVIEHQPDKRLALDEIARILRPGGLLALSFDVCEPSMGMTFPEWNGRALTLREFEAVVWSHPAFATSPPPSWNLEACERFLAWHRLSAAHHNYVVGAATLTRSSETKADGAPDVRLAARPS
jgi:SAM-dependent methyltransferase